MSERAPRPKPLRATTDTNQFISALIRRGAPFEMLEAWGRGDFIMVLSQSLAAEVADVARRPYIKERYRLTEARIQLTERQIERDAEILAELQPLPPELSVRDPKDVHVLQTALTGQVDYLITGDKDLLSLDGHQLLGGLRIVKVNDFLALLERNR